MPCQSNLDSHSQQWNVVLVEFDVRFFWIGGKWLTPRSPLHIVFSNTRVSNLGQTSLLFFSLKARFMGTTWMPSGADRTQLGPMLAPWTVLSVLALLKCFHLSLNRTLVFMVRTKPFCQIWLTLRTINITEGNIPRYGRCPTLFLLVVLCKLPLSKLVTIHLLTSLGKLTILKHANTWLYIHTYTDLHNVGALTLLFYCLKVPPAERKLHVTLRDKLNAPEQSIMECVQDVIGTYLIHPKYIFSLHFRKYR